MAGSIGVGLTGCGSLGKRQAQIACDTEGVELVGVSDVHLPSAEQVAAEHGVALATDDHQRLLEERPDAVLVVTPTHTHAQIVVDAANAGCHVFCEKPMATSVSDCERMIAACERNDVLLMIGYVLRFRNGYRDLKRMIDEGKVGELRLAWGARMGGRPPPGVGEWRRRRSEVGGLYSGACHQMDLLLWYAGPIKCVRGFVNWGSFADTDTEDSIIIAWEHESGAIGSLLSSQLYPVGGSALGVGGAEGALKLEGNNIIFSDHDRNTETYEFEPNDALVEELQHFFNCVRTGKQPLVTGRDGRDSLEVFEAAYTSAETGESIELPL